MSAPAEPRCDFSELPISMCSHCRGVPHLGDGRTRGETAAGVGSWFTARLDGVCVWGCKIVAGDTIRADGQGGYLCTDCGVGP